MLTKLQEEQLIQQAADARRYARVPMSGFRVGAALLTTDGSVFTGCNVELEKMLYSICAERCAVTKAVSEGYQDFLAIAIVSDQKAPVSPCGTCRQFLYDFGSDLQVILSNPDGSRIFRITIKDLMPKAFTGPDEGLC
ncbi:MAG: cytidine deaminase [Lachnospiraceae bacterium]|nr:cytidine deaminase [Lachnospiraceae bacterium]